MIFPGLEARLSVHWTGDHEENLVHHHLLLVFSEYYYERPSTKQNAPKTSA